MATFAVEIEGGKGLSFMKDTQLRLQNPSLAQNPFQGKIVNMQSQGNKDYYLIHMKPIYPRIYLMGLLWMMIAFMFNGVGVWLLPGILLFGTGAIWSKFFFYSVMRIGLRKQGYKGKIRLLGYNNMIDKIVNMLNAV